MYRRLALAVRGAAAPTRVRTLSAAATTTLDATTAAPTPACSVRTVGVVGAGLMGAGIAQIAAAAGFTVVNIDSSAAALQRARDAARDSLTSLAKREVKKGALAADAVAPRVEAALARITSGTDMGALAAADLVIEAVPEVRERVATSPSQLCTIAPQCVHRRD